MFALVLTNEAFLASNTISEQQQVETVINFMVRVALFAMANLKDNNIADLSPQCVGLFERALTLWPDTPIKYT